MLGTSSVRCSAWLVFGAALLFASGAAAQASKIAGALGDLRWGMSQRDVATFVKRKISERAEDELSKTKSAAKKDQIKAAAKRAIAAVDSGIVSFSGRSSRWDSSAVAGEFGYGNGESMIVHEDGNSQNYYFFLNGNLWKWYKAYDTSAFGSFKKFSQSIEKKFGKGYAKSGEVAGSKQQWVEFLDRNSRLRAADNGRRGVYALIFEEMATVRELASTRPAPSRSSARDDEEEAAPARAGDREEVARASIARKKSIFADEQQAESDAEYNARRQRLAKEERAKQSRMHDRKQDAKKGEVLKAVDGINDADPLSGL
jgi:hypothetical protein